MTLLMTVGDLIRTVAVSALIGIAGIACAQVPSSEVKVTIDFDGESRQISEQIYGVSVSGGARSYYSDLGVSVVRWGGNARSRFNWEINATNSGSDFEYRNNPKGDMVPGSGALVFHGRNTDAGAESILSVPMIGWVAKDSDLESQSIDVPGDSATTVSFEETSTGYDPSENRARTSFASFAQKGEPFVYPPNLNDDAVYQDEWVHYLTSQIGDAASGGIGLYELDNEPMIWSDTHGDIKPDPLGYDDYLELFAQYSDAIKNVDPTAQVMAPSVLGWSHLYYSAIDRGDDNFRSKTDRIAHGDTPFLQWLLSQARERDAMSGTRSLDYLSIHYYPQNEVFSDKTGTEVQARRLASTRSLWDPTYSDDSWISLDDDGPIVRLIPRMREWIDGNYPGTKLAITEWNWGANDHISGGLAVADVLGIFGSEGVDLATLWGNVKEGSPVYWAFRMYRNYDGNGSGFGDLSIKSNTDRPDFVSVHASLMSETGQTKVILINKSPDQPANVRLESIGASLGEEFQVYRYGETSELGIQRVDDVTIDLARPLIALPPYSMTLLVSKQ